MRSCQPTLDRHTRHPTHRLDAIADTEPPPELPSSSPMSSPASSILSPAPVPVRPYNGPRRKPLSAVDVYVDDFIGLGQGSKQRLRNIRGTLFHCLDTKRRQEPASIKKLKKGGVRWDTKKVVLGWLIDTVAMTMTLPQHRLERLNSILTDLPRSKQRIALKKWHRVLGHSWSSRVLQSFAGGFPHHYGKAPPPH